MEFKEKLSAAMAEPSPPQKLVEDTVHRVQTLLRGREAEKRLSLRGEITPQEKLSLAADGVLGRLAESGTLPLGADTAELKQQLLHDERFAGLAQRTGSSIVGSLEGGTWVKEMTRETIQPVARTKKDPILGK